MTSRKALVTGASAGIGAASAVALAARGVDVWLTYTSDRKAVRQTADRCRGDGVPARTSQLDLRDPGSIKSLISEVEQTWGHLHVLVNNGGVCSYTNWADVSPDHWDAVVETNARGTFLMIQAAAPILRRADGDRAIVNIASLAGQLGAQTTSIPYAASKAAVLAVTRSFARLFAAEGIRVNAVSPGPIATKMMTQLEADIRVALPDQVPLSRVGSPEHVAQVVALLASPESGFTTGATYDVNGGLRMS